MHGVLFTVIKKKVVPKSLVVNRNELVKVKKVPFQNDEDT